MPIETQRRVDGATIHNLFWINDARGRYGLYVETNEYFSARAWDLSLRGIDVIRQPGPNGGGQYFLVLRENDNWEIFALVCADLVAVAQAHLTERRLIGHMERRLRKWQGLLQRDIARALPIELQMGLFSELTFLINILTPLIGVRPSVKKWQGPEGDKQDFGFDRLGIEIKSYITTKGPIVWISSIHQLWSEKERLHLAAYGLSISEKGETVHDLVMKLGSLIGDDILLRDELEAKLGLYGYIPPIHSENLSGFLQDSLHIYNVVDDFPRVAITAIAAEITAMKYSIDLGRCSRFEFPITDLKLK